MEENIRNLQNFENYSENHTIEKVRNSHGKPERFKASENLRTYLRFIIRPYTFNR